MKGCELCHRDGALSELYCRSCCKWICSDCRTPHLAIKDSGYHDIISAAKQRRKQQLEHTLTEHLAHIHAKIESCTLQIRQCDEETTVLNQNKLTLLESSWNARQSCHEQIDELFDSIDERLESFEAANTVTYKLARDRLTDSMKQLRQLQCDIEEAKYKMSSDATSIDASLTQRMVEISSGANECVAAGATAPKLYLSLNDKLSLDGVASLKEVYGGTSFDDMQQPDAGRLPFPRNDLADFVTADENSDVSDLTKSDSDESVTPSRPLNITASSRSVPLADDVGDASVATAVVGNNDSISPDRAVVEDSEDVVTYDCRDAVRENSQNATVEDCQDATAQDCRDSVYGSSAPATSRHGRRLKPPARYIDDDHLQ